MEIISEPVHGGPFKRKNMAEQHPFRDGRLFLSSQFRPDPQDRKRRRPAHHLRPRAPPRPDRRSPKHIQRPAYMMGDVMLRVFLLCGVEELGCQNNPNILMELTFNTPISSFLSFFGSVLKRYVKSYSFFGVVNTSSPIPRACKYSFC